MQNHALDKFGEFLATQFWDRSITFYDRLAEGYWKSPSLAEIQLALQELPPEQAELVRKCVVRTLVTGLHDFLFALQEAHNFKGGISIVVDGQDVAAVSDGLHGEIFSERGWLARLGKFNEEGHLNPEN